MLTLVFHFQMMLTSCPCLGFVLVLDRGLILHSPTRQIPSFEVWRSLEAFTRPSTSPKHVLANLQIHSIFTLDGSPALAVRAAL